MERITPSTRLYDGEPCSFVAVNCARGVKTRGELSEYPDDIRNDGYVTLNNINKFVRKNLRVRNRKDFKRGERPLLKNLHVEGKAIVLVYGHLIYVEGETYHSFFENEDDEVVSVWFLRDIAE